MGPIDWREIDGWKEIDDWRKINANDKTPNPVSDAQANNPLHGITLEALLTSLVERYTWEGLGSLIHIKCFQIDPSIKSSLKFLRRTPWARAKVEELYLEMQEIDPW